MFFHLCYRIIQEVIDALHYYLILLPYLAFKLLLLDLSISLGSFLVRLYGKHCIIHVGETTMNTIRMLVVMQLD